MKDRQIEQLFFLQRDITFGVRDGVLVFSNAAGKERFPHLEPGAALTLLPQNLLDRKEETFVAHVQVGQSAYTVLGTQIEDMRIYTLSPKEDPTERERLLLENVCASMRRTLTVLNMSTEFLSPAIFQLEDPKQKANLAVLNKTYYQLERLCDNLDHFFRLRDGESCLQLEYTDIVQLCRDLVQSVDHLVEKQGARFSFQADVGQLICAIDGKKITKLLLNLISNSLSRMGAPGSMALELSVKDEDFILALRDSGPGVPPVDIGHSFETCRREQSDPQAGVGLGLSISREIAQLHGGTLLLTSQNDRGTTVFVHLPIRRMEDGGHLQEAVVPYGDAGDLRSILMELSDVLDRDAFQARYLD